MFINSQKLSFYLILIAASKRPLDSGKSIQKPFIQLNKVITTQGKLIDIMEMFEHTFYT